MDEQFAGVTGGPSGQNQISGVGLSGGGAVLLLSAADNRALPLQKQEPFLTGLRDGQNRYSQGILSIL